MGVGRVTFTILILMFTMLMFLGDCEEEKTASNLRDHKSSLRTGPIPSMGITPPQKVTKTIKGFREEKSYYDYITTEELMQNLEDAEMRGMADDPQVLEDLRYELK